MYSTIFQISDRPISANDFIHVNDIEDAIPCADYIGDVENRYDCINNLARGCRELFIQDGETLVFTGLGTFLEEWANGIKMLANDINQDNIFGCLKLHNLRSITERTHKDLYTRFYINDWNETAGPFADLIEYLKRKHAGDRLYIGAVFTYHY